MDHLSTGELLRRHRFRVGLTQQQLADRAEVSIRAVRYIEQGRVTRPQASSVRRSADALGLTGSDLDPPGGTDRQPVASTRVEVLGPLVVRRGDAPVDIESTMVRTLLGLLAIQPGQVVGGHEIVDVLWGDEPPRTCAQLVHTYIAALRRVLEPGRPRRGESSVLHRARTGYTLDLGPAGTDLDTFADLTRSAAAARRAGDCGAAGQFSAQALGLWRGPVVADCADRLRQHPVAVALAARRLAVAVDHADLALAAGRGADVIASLRMLSADEPLHEGLAARLVSALAADGQQAAALELFETVRSRLDEELGVPPGDDLRTPTCESSAARAPARRPRPAPLRPPRVPSRPSYPPTWPRSPAVPRT